MVVQNSYGLVEIWRILMFLEFLYYVADCHEVSKYVQKQDRSDDSLSCK